MDLVIRGRRKRRPYKLRFIRRFQKALSTILPLAIAGFLSSAFGAGTVTVSLDQTRNYHPGDLIELKVVVRSNEYGRYSIREPSHASLRYRETQAFPLRKVTNGQYEQRWIVLYQISRSGEIVLAGGELRDEAEGEASAISIERVVIQSDGFGSEQDPNRPEALTPLQSESSNRSWMVSVFGLLAVGLFCVWVWKRREESSRVDSLEKSPLRAAAERILAAWDTGKAPTRDLERFLRDYHSACPPSLVEMIEKALYSKTGQSAELKDRLRKEFVS